MATNNNNNNATLASRAAGLLTKTATLAVAEKAISQAIVARRVFPPMAEDFGAQLGHDLPLKTKDFVRVVGHLLSATDKPLKGVISKKKHDILQVLADLVSALTDTTPINLPLWALPKERAKTSEAEELRKVEKLANAEGALNKANVLAEAEAKAEAAEANAEAKAEAAEANADKKLADAIDLIVSRAADLTDAQRRIILAVLSSTEAEA